MISSYIETDIEKCELLWKEFSPNQSLFDLWDFRLVFYLVYGYQPYFIVLRENGKNIGLLPLWYEKEKERYLWFGGWWQEDAAFWAKNSADILTLLSLCPGQTFLKGIAMESATAEEVRKVISEREKK